MTPLRLDHLRNYRLDAVAPRFAHIIANRTRTEVAIFRMRVVRPRRTERRTEVGVDLSTRIPGETQLVARPLLVATRRNRIGELEVRSGTPVEFDRRRIR